jgi:hypothetical protein
VIKDNVKIMVAADIKAVEYADSAWIDQLQLPGWKILGGLRAALGSHAGLCPLL